MLVGVQCLLREFQHVTSVLQVTRRKTAAPQMIILSFCLFGRVLRIANLFLTKSGEELFLQTCLQATAQPYTRPCFSDAISSVASVLPNLSDTDPCTL